MAGTEKIVLKVSITVDYPGDQEALIGEVDTILAPYAKVQRWRAIDVGGLYRLPSADSRSDWPEDP